MALAKRNYKKENKQPINKFIKADKVRLISSSGEQLGIKSIDDALSIAAKENLDLVQLNDDKDTPVCKLMNYGKHLFDKKKQKSASKKKQKKTQIKEVKFRPGTEENDYQIKLKKIIKFLDEGLRARLVSFLVDLSSLTDGKTTSQSMLWQPSYKSNYARCCARISAVRME